jgi:hypothetical protein
MAGRGRGGSGSSRTRGGQAMGLAGSPVVFVGVVWASGAERPAPRDARSRELTSDSWWESCRSTSCRRGWGCRQGRPDTA